MTLNPLRSFAGRLALAGLPGLISLPRIGGWIAEGCPMPDALQGTSLFVAACAAASVAAVILAERHGSAARSDE
jgi:hypothetical protein